MDFINGFFLVNFLPFGILVLIGIILFFSRKFKVEKWHSTLLFIVIVLIVLSAWRIPDNYQPALCYASAGSGHCYQCICNNAAEGYISAVQDKTCQSGSTAGSRGVIDCVPGQSAAFFKTANHICRNFLNRYRRTLTKVILKIAVVLIFGNPGGQS